jgi:hypothetical protein
LLFVHPIHLGGSDFLGTLSILSGLVLGKFTFTVSALSSFLAALISLNLFILTLDTSLLLASGFNGMDDRLLLFLITLLSSYFYGFFFSDLFITLFALLFLDLLGGNALLLGDLRHLVEVLSFLSLGLFTLFLFFFSLKVI